MAKILKESGLKYKQRVKVPETRATKTAKKTRLRRLARDPFSPATDCDVVMDDESYFTFSGSDVPASAGFYVGPDGDASDNVRFRPE